jgi:hypothetical protein
MQTAKTVIEAIERSRSCDEIVAVKVGDIDAAIEECRVDGNLHMEVVDWAEDAAREDGSPVVSIWGYDSTTGDTDHCEWRIEIVGGGL